MRVITGKARGVVLKTTEGLHIRPTTDRIKEAVFSSIHFDVPGAMVLDLFSGSGQMGIEALSRDAKKCVFVDDTRNSSLVQIENLKKAKLFADAKVLTMDAKSYLMTTKDNFDIIFMDPPYKSEFTEEIVALAFEKVSPDGKLIVETDKSEEIFLKSDDILKQKEYNYGKTKITIFTKGGE